MSILSGEDKRNLLKAITAGMIFQDRNANKERGERDPFRLLLIETVATCKVIMRPFMGKS